VDVDGLKLTFACAMGVEERAARRLGPTVRLGLGAVNGIPPQGRLVSFGIAGALLIIVAPVEPTLDRAYIGRTFCVVVMAGLGSMTGTLVAAIILGVAETIVLTLFGASWAPAISFAMLLGVLAVRPQGLFGRRS